MMGCILLILFILSKSISTAENAKGAEKRVKKTISRRYLDVFGATTARRKCGKSAVKFSGNGSHKRFAEINPGGVIPGKSEQVENEQGCGFAVFRHPIFH
jgi:hypothetical protein